MNASDGEVDWRDIQDANHGIRNALFVIRGHIELMQRSAGQPVSPAVLERIMQACTMVETRSDEITAILRQLRGQAAEAERGPSP